MRTAHDTSPASGLAPAARVVLLAVTLAVTAAHARPAAQGAWAREAQEAVARQAVVEVLEGPDSDAAEVLAGLRRIGPQAGPHCFDLLVDGALSAGARGRARLALTRLDSAPLWLHLAWLATGRPPVESQDLGAELLGERGTGDQIALLCQLTEPPADGDGGLADSTERAVEIALSDILLRDPDSYSFLHYRYSRCHPAQRLPIVRGLGRTRSTRALELLPQFLLGDDSFDALVLNQLALVAAERRRPVPDDTRSRARQYLSGARAERARRQAALTAAFLHDHEAVPLLIEMLEGEEDSLSRDAHWSLTQLTGLGFRLDARRWRAWLEEELGFWDERAGVLFERLDRGGEQAALLALSEISDRRGFRHDLAREVSTVLGRPEEVLVLRALATLERLGSLAVMEELIELVSDAREPVAREARRVLVSLTGEDHGAEPSSWREAY